MIVLDMVLGATAVGALAVAAYYKVQAEAGEREAQCEYERAQRFAELIATSEKEELLPAWVETYVEALERTGHLSSYYRDDNRRWYIRTISPEVSLIGGRLMPLLRQARAMHTAGRKAEVAE